MPKSVSEMVGEVLRGIGVVAIVPVPLDMILTQGPIHWRVVAYALGIGFLALILGIVLRGYDHEGISPMDGLRRIRNWALPVGTGISPKRT